MLNARHQGSAEYSSICDVQKLLAISANEAGSRLDVF